MKQQFNPTLAIEVDRCLAQIARNIAMDLALAKTVLEQVEAEHESLYDSEGQGPFPLCANLSRFEALFHWTFNDNVMRLDKEIDSLRRVWQLKLGAFYKTTGEWTYE